MCYNDAEKDPVEDRDVVALFHDTGRFSQRLDDFGHNTHQQLHDINESINALHDSMDELDHLIIILGVTLMGIRQALRYIRAQLLVTKYLLLLLLLCFWGISFLLDRILEMQQEPFLPWVFRVLLHIWQVVFVGPFLFFWHILLSRISILRRLHMSA